MNKKHITQVIDEVGQSAVGKLLHKHQTTISLMVLSGRDIYLYFDNGGLFIKAVEEKVLYAA